MKHRLSLIVAGVALLTSLAAPAQSAANDTQPACRARPALPEGRPRIGLVLGGGGARGIAHISVLRTLEELKVPIDCIAGTSMGSLVGALYASGMTVDEIQELVLTLDWDRMFNDKLERPERSYRRKRDDELVVSQPGVGFGKKGIQLAPGILAGERILLTFQKLIEPVSPIEDFDQLPIPYRAVAADINDGSAVVIQGGDLALAMRASMSIPGAFPPVVMNDRVLVDGGVASNLPVAAARAMGADIIIAVDVGTPLTKIGSDSSVLGVTEQLVGLLTVGNTKATIASLGPDDILISPPLGDRVATADFTKGVEALAIGMEGVEVVRSRLQQLGISEQAYAQNRSVRTGRLTAPPVIEFVKIDNRSRYSDDIVLSRLNIPLGQPLDSADVERQMHLLFGTNTLSLSTYEVVQEDGKTGLQLHVVGKSQGPNYLEAGLSMSSDFEGRYDFNLRLGVLMSPINESGDEVRLLAQLGDETQLLGEYYHPIFLDGKYFFGARGVYFDRKLNAFDGDGNKFAEFSARQIGAQFSFGREFGNYGALGVGYRRYTGHSEVLVGDPLLGDYDFEIGAAHVEAAIDRLDSFYFPREGYIVRSDYLFSRESLGADVDFDQFDLDALYAYRFDRHAVQFGGRYHVTVSGVAPLESAYRLGGYTRLAGYQPNELVGQNYAMLLMGYSYEIAKVLRMPALLGGSLEYGNVWQDRSDMAFDEGDLNGSVYIGLDSWVGPILFGIGAREGGFHNVFLEVGHKF